MFPYWKKKKFNNKGFTLIEMLIVVAIIALLIMILITVFNNQIDKINQTVDDANFKTAQTKLTAMYLSGEYNIDDPGDMIFQYFNIETGEFQKDLPKSPYGRKKKGCVLQIASFDKFGTIELDWYLCK